MSEQITSPTPSPERARKNRRLLLILLASFIIPFVIGDLAYRFGWYEGGKINKGQLLNPPAGFTEFHARNATGERLDSSFASSSWWLLYVMPSECDTACRNRLFQMRQVRKALGKEGDRLGQLLVFTGPTSSTTDALLKNEFPGFVRIEADAANVNAALQRAAARASEAGHLYIMDPMGWIMLTYPPVPDEKASVVKAEEVLKDLRKLLKGSRIG